MIKDFAEKKHSIKGNIFLSTGYQVLNMIIPLITAPYVSRVLGADGVGIYSYTHSYSMYFTLFAALGTVAYGTREIARHRDNKEDVSQLFWEIACLSFASSAVCLAGWGIWILFNQDYRIYYLVLTFFLLGTMFDISWLYAGLEEFRYTVLQNSVFKILGTIAIFVFVKEKSDLWIYILILALTVFLANASMWIYVPKFVDPVPVRSIRLGRHFRETLVYFIPTIAISIYTVLDKTLLGLITHDTSENGNYEQATKIINMAKTVSFMGVNTVLQSRISYLFAENRIDEIKDRIKTAADFILFLGMGCTFGMIGVADRFVPWFFGAGYDKTIMLLKCMAPLIVIIGISNCLGTQYYNPAGLRALSAKFIIIGSATNLIFNLLLIPHLRSVGAVIATLIAEMLITALYMRYCNGFYTMYSLVSQSWKKILSGLTMCVCVSMIGRLDIGSFQCVILQVASGMLIYIAILLILRDDFLCEYAIPQSKNMFIKAKKRG